MSDHVSSLCRAWFFQLCQLRQVRSSLTTDTTKTFVHAFISSRLDYCNSLLCGVNDGLLKKLQTVQNAAARVTTRQKQERLTTSDLSCVNSTDLQFVIASSTNWQWWSTSVCMDWRHHIWPLIVYLWRQWPADDISGLLRPVASLSLERTLDSGHETSRSLGRRFGTVFQLICDSTHSQ